MRKFLPKTVNNPQGFTLVELLVVVAIIAILSVIGMVIFSTVQKNARDARRRADVDAIANALEANYNNNTGTYPAVAPGMFSANLIPLDPSGGGYHYVRNTAGTEYSICADLEFNGIGAAGAPQDDYCRTEQQ